MKPAGLAVLLVIGVLIIGSAFIVSRENGTSTSTTVSSTPVAASSEAEATSNSSMITTSANGSCGPGVPTMTVNGMEFCSDDVSNDTVVGNPGNGYFKNGSVSFMGVTFQTICPPGGMGCPGVTSATATMFSGEMKFTMTFPDHTNETVWGLTGVDPYIAMLSLHSNPRAGMVIEETYDAQARQEIVKVFLLVGQP